MYHMKAPYLYMLIVYSELEVHYLAIPDFEQ